MVTQRERRLERVLLLGGPVASVPTWVEMFEVSEDLVGLEASDPFPVPADFLEFAHEFGLELF